MDVKERAGVLSMTKVPRCLKEKWNHDLQNGNVNGLRSDLHATIYQILEVTGQFLLFIGSKVKWFYRL